MAVLVHIVQENWSKKKLARALFIDVKGAFNYVSKCQLLTRMIDLVAWPKSFPTNCYDSHFRASLSQDLSLNAFQC